MTRSTKEWVGKTDDHKAPKSVRTRIFDRDNGICHICKLPIKVPFETWQADHVVALINGGENREMNLAPAHSHCHIAKTTEDVAEKSKVTKTRQKHIGVKAEPARPMKSRGFAKKERHPKPSLAPRQLYISTEAKQ